MKFNVSSLLQEGIGAIRHYEIDSALEAPGERPEQVKGGVEFLRTRDGVLVRANLVMVEPESCSRCLRPLHEQVEVKFEEEFIASVDVKTGRPVARSMVSPQAFPIDERHTLDLNEAVRQYREVCLLMKPLCRPDCRGLCAVCGEDLNQGPCGHDTEAIDSRWEGLAAFGASGLGGKESGS